MKSYELGEFPPNQVHHEGHGGGEDHGVAGEEAEAGGRGVDWRQEDTWWKQAHHAGANQSFFIVFNLLDLHQLRISSICAHHTGALSRD